MIGAAEAEREVGIDWYSTGSAPCAGRARTSADDFMVEEQVELSGLVEGPLAGYYPVYRVEKQDVDTLHMAQEIAKALKSRVSYGGLKDKRASAVQYVTPTSLRGARPSSVVGKNFTAELIGYLPSPLTRANVVGNRFEVVLRECCAEIGPAIRDAFRIAEAGGLPNFYGLQRFGVSGPGTHRIGRALVRREFEEAVRLMLFGGLPGEEDLAIAEGEEMTSGRLGEWVRLLPKGRDVERAVGERLARRPGDWIGALRGAPIKLRRLYVQAYQSMLFNKTLSIAIGKGEDISRFQPGDNWAEASPDRLRISRVRGVRDPPTAGAVPMAQLVGYAYRDYGSRFDACVREAMEAEGVSPGQFYVEEMQEVSAEGGFRRPHMALKDGSWTVQGKDATLRFTLGRGQYATVLLREVVKAGDPAGSGLA